MRGSAGKLVLASSIATDMARPGRDPSRVIDLILGSLALLFFAPLMLVVAAAVYLTNPGPLLSGHVRIGRHGHSFTCWKFRSMAVDADRPTFRESRTTPIGTLLQRTSIDQIPQLFNILKGEMSLVGPRPIMAEERQLYGRYFVEYCRVRPGITGLWQVDGLDSRSYRRRVAADVTYVRAKSVTLDMKLLLRTLAWLVRG